MTDEDPGHHFVTGVLPTRTSSPPRAPLREILAWMVPWLVGALLAFSALFGFFTASGAEDNGTYAAGFVTAGLSLVALGWCVKRYFDRRAEDFAQSIDVVILVEQTDSLLVLIALLVALGIGGLFLCAYAEGAASNAGFALFVVSLIFIFWNLKHYFDMRERRPPH